jgi:hypothetical protein
LELGQKQTQMQEELNWLGASRKGAKGKGKGAGAWPSAWGKGEKDGGKGKGGKFGGKGGKGGKVCHWCNKPDHIKADCKEFAAWKVAADKKRADQGLLPFVPRAPSGPMRSLEISNDYVSFGMMEEQDDDYRDGPSYSLDMIRSPGRLPSTLLMMAG